ncbi:MAG: 4Fe-4S dicluster domain-containing protein [Solirubrobacteraceae bacterium]
MDAVHWKKIQRIAPWLVNKEPIPEREYIVSHESMVDVTQTMACIQCGACVSDCLAMEVDPQFVGRAARAKSYRFVGDPRDAQQFERLKDLSDDKHGIYDCTHCFNCIDACPKGVDPMSQIMRVRRIAGSDQNIVGLHGARNGLNAPWGPRTIAPVPTSYSAACHGHRRHPSSVTRPLPSGANRWR